MKKILFIFVLLLLGAIRPSFAEPTFADLAVFCAKGYFKNDVPSDASVKTCVSFLNRQGIAFSLFDLIDPYAEVSYEDFSRVVGQSTLLCLGEAEFDRGHIKKPLEAVTWVDYCLLNDVDSKNLWMGFLRKVESGSFPEVKVFYSGAM